MPTNSIFSIIGRPRGSSADYVVAISILFRLGKLDASLDIYRKLEKSKIESLEINLILWFAFTGRASSARSDGGSRVKATSDFELAYNTACSLIERKKYSDLEQLLCRLEETLMEDNLADDDIEVELAPITVQLAHVQQLLGHTQEAIEAYTDIIKRNLADESSLAVASNNLVSLKGPKDVSDSLRKLDRLIEKGSGPQIFQLARGLDLKLSPKQREAIYANRALLLLHSNRIDQARELVAALPDMFPDSVMPVLLQAAVLVRENKAGRAEEILGQFSEKFPDKSKVVLLARAQVAAAAGHPQVAAESLSKIPDIQHMPATVATLISLKERAGDIDGAIAVFDSAIQWWSNAMAEDNKLNVIMQEAASFKLKHGRKEEAARLYEELVKSHGSIEALVGLIKTTAHSDIDKAEAYEKQLKPLPGLKSVDVDSLEKTSGAKHVESVLHVTEQFEAKGKEKAKKKRKRKPKYPKGFNPANPGPPPDPERWLPKRERSSYRPKRKDKRAAQVRGSQGAVAKEAVNANAKSNQTTNVKAASLQNAVAEQSKPSSKSSRKKSRN
ncbi:Signal recognition particle subunit SRP72 [Camellia lanceoleosa]|uniref:Signal recognition particle subunit SRP72 n=1 Tax=Camellia lanceoleosa TaxID=1840588 RepID=A0ACC0IBC2_9ERIC|nr:Signal recognition particle subunit SRP72 [Camellia lanceoleosa]